MLEYIKPKKISLRQHPEYSEKWVQELIFADPSILGLGDSLIVLSEQKRQPSGGKLDLLLKDNETNKRYEVELQLGASDPSHIIRTIEYWDIERKRYPRYDHCAVLVAEDITSRFLNVVSLFNGHIPLIAIQMQALEVGERLTLSFIKVMDEMTRGKDEEEEPTPTDRAYWKRVASKETVEMADEALKIIHEFASEWQLNYTQGYIGLTQNGRANNFVSFVPQRRRMHLGIRLKETNDITSKINDDTELDMLPYDGVYGGYYRLRLEKGDLFKYKDILKELMEMSFNEYGRR